jgi:hypothetical protein
LKSHVLDHVSLFSLANLTRTVISFRYELIISILNSFVTPAAARTRTAPARPGPPAESQWPWGAPAWWSRSSARSSPATQQPWRAAARAAWPVHTHASTHSRLSAHSCVSAQPPLSTAASQHAAASQHSRLSAHSCVSAQPPLSTQLRLSTAASQHNRPESAAPPLVHPRAQTPAPTAALLLGPGVETHRLSRRVVHGRWCGWRHRLQRSRDGQHRHLRLHHLCPPAQRQIHLRAGLSWHVSTLCGSLCRTSS